MRATPSSVAFWTTRSIFALLSSAGASTSARGGSRAGRAVATIAADASRPPTRSRRTSCSAPCSSKTTRTSPGRRRSVRRCLSSAPLIRTRPPAAWVLGTKRRSTTRPARASACASGGRARPLGRGGVRHRSDRAAPAHAAPRRAHAGGRAAGGGGGGGVAEEGGGGGAGGDALPGGGGGGGPLDPKKLLHAEIGR